MLLWDVQMSDLQTDIPTEISVIKHFYLKLNSKTLKGNK